MLGAGWKASSGRIKGTEQGSLGEKECRICGLQPKVQDYLPGLAMLDAFSLLCLPLILGLPIPFVPSIRQLSSAGYCVLWEVQIVHETKEEAMG